jgi:hypothetical protein
MGEVVERQQEEEVVARPLARRAATFVGSALLLPAAALLYAGAGGVSGCGRGARPPSASRLGEPLRTRVTVLLGEAGGFHFVLSPIHPEAGRARTDSESLARRFFLPGAGLATLHVLRFEGTSGEFDPKEAVVRATSEEGEEVTLRPLATFRPPSSQLDALVFRTLAGPGDRATLAPGSWIPLALVVPGARDPERFRRAEVAGAVLEPARVDLEDWKAFLVSPKRDLFRSAAAPSSARGDR